jgi:hypothetical protein
MHQYYVMQNQVWTTVSHGFSLLSKLKFPSSEVYQRKIIFPINFLKGRESLKGMNCLATIKRNQPCVSNDYLTSGFFQDLQLLGVTE